MCVVSVGAEVAQVFCYLGKVSYMYLGMYVSKDFLSLVYVEDVCLVAHYSHVLLPCRRTPFLLPISRLLFVSMLRSWFGAERVFRRERKKKHSELLERQKVLFGAKREFEREEEKSQILEQKKAKDQEVS